MMNIFLVSPQSLSFVFYVHFTVLKAFDLNSFDWCTAYSYFLQYIKVYYGLDLIMSLCNKWRSFLNQEKTRFIKSLE